MALGVMTFSSPAVTTGQSLDGSRPPAHHCSILEPAFGRDRGLMAEPRVIDAPKQT